MEDGTEVENHTLGWLNQAIEFFKELSLNSARASHNEKDDRKMGYKIGYSAGLDFAAGYLLSEIRKHGYTERD